MDAPKQFLTHINGLRGLAILAIVLYHLSASLSPCGYFGVDVFLVISGYFLFRNDLPRLADGRLRLRDYAARKLWRIVPPWMAVALPVTLLCIYLMAYERNVTIAGTVGATAFGFANDYVAFSGSYFNPHVQQNPLMHLWYIGLTEQIYILLPLLALLPARCGKRAVRLSLAAAGLLSLLLCAFLNYGQHVAACADTVAELNAAVFDNSRDNQARCLDVMKCQGMHPDLVFLDPPLQQPPVDLLKSCHFMEGLARNWQGVNFMAGDPSHRFAAEPSVFDGPGNAAALQQIFTQFKDSIIMVLVPCHADPAPQAVCDLLKKVKQDVRQIPLGLKRTKVKDYLIVGA